MKVELRDICKAFGPVRANDGISLTWEGGGIYGVLGENGAGKSTLLKILSGFLRPDRGVILLDGKPVVLRSPADGQRLGIGMLHQDPMDFPPLTVLENFLLGRRGRIGLGASAARAELEARGRAYGFALDPDARVESLTVGERQQLEILRLLSLGAQVLLLDEPTTGISEQQRARLFGALRRLAAEGRTIVLVSHKLGDAEELCSRIAVLRKGRVVGEVGPPYRGEQLVELMFGEALPKVERCGGVRGEVMLEVEGLWVETGRVALRNLNLKVRAGEVIGLAGVEGSGQELFLRTCAGLARPIRGRIRIAGRDLTRQPYRRFLEAGVAYVPAARLEEGLVRGLTLAEHVALAMPARGFLVDRRRVAHATWERIRQFRIHGFPETPVEALSGGNQQRALLALLEEDRRVLLVEHPTRGLDVESAHDIWARLRERCRRGQCLLFTSTDLEELLQYSDRVVVFFAGRCSPPLDAATATVEQLGRRIGGEGWEEASCSVSVRG